MRSEMMEKLYPERADGVSHTLLAAMLTQVPVHQLASYERLSRFGGANGMQYGSLRPICPLQP